MAIALLVVLARNAPGTTSPFSSLLDPVTLTCTLFSWRALRNVNIGKESSIGTDSLIIDAGDTVVVDIEYGR